MKKIFLSIVLCITITNIVFAQELVLSDRIREAREAAQKEAVKAKVNEQFKPVREVIQNSDENLPLKTDTDKKDVIK